MLVIQKCLDQIRFSIPKPILEEVFINRTIQWRAQPPTIDEQITALVLRPRMLVDCNLIGGTEALIDLSGVNFERSDDYTSVYRIPKDLTQNRSISSVLNITYSDPTKLSSYGVAAGQQNTMMLQLGSGVMDAYGSIPVTSTARVQLIGENVVMVRDTVILPANIFLRCILAYDENMTGIQLRSYKYLAELAVLAVKAYIYNQLTIQIDIGQLLGGQVVGKFKEIVDSYSDANELYEVFLHEKVMKVLYIQNQEGYTRLLKLMISGNR